MNSQPPIIPDWKWGTAEGSREFDRLMDRRMTFREKIQWLEEAEDLTLAMAASREKLRVVQATAAAPEREIGVLPPSHHRAFPFPEPAAD